MRSLRDTLIVCYQNDRPEDPTAATASSTNSIPLDRPQRDDGVPGVLTAIGRAASGNNQPNTRDLMVKADQPP
jgi:hypothetical protein